MPSVFARCWGALFPSSCHACGGKLLDPPASPPRFDLLCRSCAAALQADGTEHRLADRLPLLATFRPGRVPMALIRGLKYGGRDAALPLLAQAMAQRLTESDWPRPWHLVPVPLPLPRRIRRGFNQSELLARRLARCSGAGRPMSLLSRRFLAGQQVARGREERLRMAGREFRLRRRAPAGGTLILVDDLCTTGATLLACAEVLGERPAGALGALVLLRVPLTGVSRSVP